MDTCCKKVFRETLAEVLYFIRANRITDINKLVSTLHIAILSLEEKDKKAGN